MLLQDVAELPVAGAAPLLTNLFPRHCPARQVSASGTCGEKPLGKI